MFRLRVTTDCQPRTKKGQPPQSTTGVARTSWIHSRAVTLSRPTTSGIDHAAHLEREERHRERDADPEAPSHVDQLGVRLFLRDRLERLQRHAALRAAPGPDLADLGMHRAGVDARVGTPSTPAPACGAAWAPARRTSTGRPRTCPGTRGCRTSTSSPRARRCRRPHDRASRPCRRPGPSRSGARAPRLDAPARRDRGYREGDSSSCLLSSLVRLSAGGHRSAPPAPLRPAAEPGPRAPSFTSMPSRARSPSLALSATVPEGC